MNKKKSEAQGPVENVLFFSTAVAHTGEGLFFCFCFFFESADDGVAQAGCCLWFDSA
jgi:hypothetical protein